MLRANLVAICCMVFQSLYDIEYHLSVLKTTFVGEKETKI